MTRVALSMDCMALAIGLGGSILVDRMAPPPWNIHLLPLPQDNIRSLYKIKESSVLADSQAFVSYGGKKYSTPIKNCGKRLNIQAFDDYLYVYDNTELVVIHQISNDDRKKIELPEHAIEKLEFSLGTNGPKIKEMAESNLKELGEMYK